ncbi:MAG: DNA phosphorothioation-associated putative methyltransferase [Proteobacteria bacterium]|nr:DNA phosphorothioation-associated putative methyltransferase [Pseudomonadota bacterium]MBU1057843.1 DNA phosphorothioation-associated putative methyltransferase [Pseudomonadota bacterium]
MDFAEYKKLVGQLKVGKRLPDAIYLHQSAMAAVPNDLHAYLFKTIEKIEIASTPWNIVKFFKKDFKISLLFYPAFFEDSYPALHASHTIDLQKNTVRSSSYEKSENPPILHRKETFLESTHPSVPVFREITREGEKAGLFENTRTIGFKKSWELLITKKGYVLLNGHLQRNKDKIPTPVNATYPQEIARHRTAIDRNKLSTPMQSLLRHNYFERQYSLFDYGCGKGDDLTILRENGVEASGWDPVYNPDKPKIPSDIVNLGFVINVIENPKERKETLQQAFKQTKKILVVSAMLGGESITSQFKEFGDGVVTSRNTFQKYYTQTELKNYIADSLNQDPVAVGPGLFYVFKDEIEEQNFLVQRQTSKKTWLRLSYTDHPEKLKIQQRSLLERHRELFDDFWNLCLDLGRLPANAEFEFSERIRALCGSHARALTVLTTFHGDEIFRQAAQARCDDLLVYFALGLFGQRKPYVHMPEGLKRDIKSFFGKYTDALNQAKDLLFSVGKPDTIQTACEEFYDRVPKGKMVEGHSLTIHRDYLNELPAVLRVYIGYATQLYGDIENANLIKIHICSGKVSLMRYDDFEGKPLPLLLERIKVKLKEQSIDFFNYTGKYKPQPLYVKTTYIGGDFPYFKQQLAFDKRLKSFKWLDLKEFGPAWEDFESNLKEQEGLVIRGYRFYRQ